MNRKGNPENLVASHPENTSAVKSGAHSPRLIRARAEEIMQTMIVSPDLDEAGRFALAEVARLTGLVEAIDADLDKQGFTDKKGNERYLVQRRERFSRRLLDAHDRLVEALERAKKKAATNRADGVVGEPRDYVRHLQMIGLGHDPEAQVTDQFNALKLLLGLGPKGSSSYYEPRTLPYADDPEVAALYAELEGAGRAGHIERLRSEITMKRTGG
jgi:hypothetical protein